MYLVTVTGGTLPHATGHAPAYAPAAEQAIYSTSDFRVHVICIHIYAMAMYSMYNAMFIPCV